jgi:hypothetical protein
MLTTPTQVVEGLVEPTHQLRVSRVNKADGLRAVDHLTECVMEECILDIELVDGCKDRWTKRGGVN